MGKSTMNGHFQQLFWHNQRVDHGLMDVWGCDGGSAGSSLGSSTWWRNSKRILWAPLRQWCLQWQSAALGDGRTCLRPSLRVDLLWICQREVIMPSLSLCLYCFVYTYMYIYNLYYMDAYHNMCNYIVYSVCMYSVYRKCSIYTCNIIYYNYYSIIYIIHELCMCM